MYRYVVYDNTDSLEDVSNRPNKIAPIKQIQLFQMSFIVFYTSHAVA